MKNEHYIGFTNSVSQKTIIIGIYMYNDFACEMECVIRWVGDDVFFSQWYGDQHLDILSDLTDHLKKHTIGRRGTDIRLAPNILPEEHVEFLTCAGFIDRSKKSNIKNAAPSITASSFNVGPLVALPIVKIKESKFAHLFDDRYEYVVPFRGPDYYGVGCLTSVYKPFDAMFDGKFKVLSNDILFEKQGDAVLCRLMLG